MLYNVHVILCCFILFLLLSQIQAGAAGLISGASLFVFGTVYSYFIFFAKEDEMDWTGF